MNKRVMSVIVVIFTVLCVGLMLLGDKILRKPIEHSDKVQVFNSNVSIERDINSVNLENKKKETLVDFSKEDKDRIYTIASKLYPEDKERVKEYIENDDFSSAIDLLEQRLTPKEYERIKSLINKNKKNK